MKSSNLYGPTELRNEPILPRLSNRDQDHSLNGGEHKIENKLLMGKLSRRSPQDGRCVVETPILLSGAWNCHGCKALVSKSVIWLREEPNIDWITPALSFSRTKWQSKSTCLVLLWQTELDVIVWLPGCHNKRAQDIPRLAANQESTLSHRSRVL